MDFASRTWHALQSTYTTLTVGLFLCAKIWYNMYWSWLQSCSFLYLGSCSICILLLYLHNYSFPALLFFFFFFHFSFWGSSRKSLLGQVLLFLIDLPWCLLLLLLLARLWRIFCKTVLFQMIQICMQMGSTVRLLLDLTWVEKVATFGKLLLLLWWLR